MSTRTKHNMKLKRRMFKCNFCDRTMQTLQALNAHKLLHKKTEKVVKPSKSKAKASLDTKLNEGDVRKIQFECPKCGIMFSSHFEAFSHIRQEHYSTTSGEKLNSRKLPIPIRTEVCVKCNKKIVSSHAHTCLDTNVETDGKNYVCAGCDQKFTSIELFDMHVSGLHSDSVESLYFPKMNDFLTWKSHMETQTKVKYLILGKCSEKQTYSCTAVKDNKSVICPSSIVVQEYSKSIQVHFYKKHFGHECDEYVLADEYKKYDITSLMQKPKEGTEMTQKDLYAHFKNLMENILSEAKNINLDSLKVLLSKALEMSSSLTNDSLEFKGTLNDDQIAKALEQLGKRKIITRNVDAKKAKVDPKIDSPKLDTSKIDAPKIESPKIKEVPTFNDTYKDFVENNFKKDDVKTVKSRSTSRSKTLNELRKVKPNNVDVIKTETTDVVVAVKPQTQKKETNTNSDSINDTKDFIKPKKEIVMKPINKPKRNLLKTKIGQFKPSIIPRKKDDLNNSLEKLKVDFDYEVKERENDCNILILKI